MPDLFKAIESRRDSFTAGLWTFEHQQQVDADMGTLLSEVRRFAEVRDEERLRLLLVIDADAGSEYADREAARLELTEELRAPRAGEPATSAARAPSCSCPAEPPIDFGRGWTHTRGGFICSRCGGAMRDTQRVQIAEEFRSAGLVAPGIKPGGLIYRAPRASRERLRNQRRELRRLNLVIQQMSWKLHVKRRRAWAEAFHPNPFSPIVIGGVTTAVLLLIVAVLVFS